MEDYLLGEKEVVNRDERTGYLFLEFKKDNQERYLTIGIGMQAKRHKGIKSWYFLILDNRRIGNDFQLSHLHLGDKIPFSAKELENRIGNGGFVVHTQREYMDLVNKYIFGFHSLDAYEDLIKLLIQLRSPKLSKDFKPTVIYEILESALPPLTDDELRHLSDTIENMDQMQQQLEQLEREYEASNKLVNQYDKYNQYILSERAYHWKNANQKQIEAEQQVNCLIQKEQEIEDTICQLEQQRMKAYQQKEVADNEKVRLQTHEIWGLSNELNKKNETVKNLNKDVATLIEKLSKKHTQYNQIKKKQDQAKDELYKQEQVIKELLEELQFNAEEAAFSQHDVNVNDFKRLEKDGFNFSVWLQEISRHEKQLQSIIQLINDQERYLQERTQLESNRSDKKMKVDELNKNSEHLEEWFTEVKQTLEHQIFQWMEEHPKLHFTPENTQSIAVSLQGLFDLNRFEDVREILNDSLNNYNAKITADIKVIQTTIENQMKELRAKQDELNHWKALKMPNPERSHDTEIFREQLQFNQLNYVPFYAAVEFHDHITDEQKERLEAALKQTGLLDSLITNQPIRPIHDKVVVPNPVVIGHTLADYLRPDLDANSIISNETVAEILCSVPLEREDFGFHIDADGSYSFGCLIGHAPKEEASKYIGRSSRKRYQQQMIQSIKGELETIELHLEESHKKLQSYEVELKNIEVWKQEIPSEKDLSDIHYQIIKNKQELNYHQELLQGLDQQWKLVLEKLSSIKTALHEQGNHLNLTFTRDALIEASNAAESYRNDIHKLEKVFQKKSHINNQLHDFLERIKEVELELDEIKGDQNIKDEQLSKMKAEIVSIENQLKLKGIDEIRLRIQQVQRELQTAENIIQKLNESIPTKESEQSKCKEKLETEKNSLHFWLNMSNEWERMVEEEIKLGFIEIEKHTANDILSQVGEVLSKYDRSKLSEQLTKVFLNEQTQLMEYRMFDYTAETTSPEWFTEGWDDYYESFMQQWRQLQSRRIIQMDYRGQRVNPYFVRESLEKELTEQKGWLDEQDRQLYEDIIVNTVGVILRNRIQRAEKWVKQMDKIMENRDNSSGLTFSIAWKPLTADSEQELDTKELVQLLQRNSKFLNEEDLNRITKHFQSRISKAKELIELRNEGSTLHQVLKEVLDYRKWFSFVLSYKRVNEPKRELTNNAFFKFSGGEKAMAMYIPLFTAAYSRYKEAADIAPHIISLDEAFAGVDENNIRDMFKVVEQLGFNYIMNSQALWGDYDTITNLSICELVRSKNADFVTVIRYLWNGKQRTLVMDDAANEEMYQH